MGSRRMHPHHSHHYHLGSHRLARAKGPDLWQSHSSTNYELGRCSLQLGRDTCTPHQCRRSDNTKSTKATARMDVHTLKLRYTTCHVSPFGLNGKCEPSHARETGRKPRLEANLSCTAVRSSRGPRCPRHVHWFEALRASISILIQILLKRALPDRCSISEQAP